MSIWTECILFTEIPRIKFSLVLLNSQNMTVHIQIMRLKSESLDDGSVFFFALYMKSVLMLSSNITSLKSIAVSQIPRDKH